VSGIRNRHFAAAGYGLGGAGTRHRACFPGTGFPFRGIGAPEVEWGFQAGIRILFFFFSKYAKIREDKENQRGEKK